MTDKEGKAIVYYAKSATNGFQETVCRHVRKVSQLAGAFAQVFGCEEEGRIAGLLHDFGKYTPLFQEVLVGRQHRVNHAAAGALFAREFCRQKLKAPENAYTTLAMVIFAHHSWLESNIKALLDQSYRSDDPCFDRQDKQISVTGPKAFQNSIHIFMEQNGKVLPRTPLKAPNIGECGNDNLAYMLYVRMLFSTLVDADYCVSAQDDRIDDPPSAETSPLRIEDILQEMERHRQNIKKKSTANAKINRIREELFQNCLQAANHPPGLFTLTAPTGTGKTLSLFAFGLRHAQAHQKKRIIIVLPYLSIIQQNAAVYRGLADDVLEDHSQSHLDEEKRLFAQRWSAPVIVTTSVKFFESLFASRPTDCRRLHHLTDSVVVFDEAQSLPPRLTGATLDAVNVLCSRYGCSVVFSTATQPAFDFRNDVKWNPTEIVRDPKSMFKDTKRVAVEWRLEHPFSLVEIAAQMAAEPICCAIVNLRKHARTLFSALRKACPDSESLFFMSTDLCMAHRETVLNTIRDRIERHMPCRLVSTQCIEAGVDLDFPLLFRALAPLESIVQAAGRCNRNGQDTLGRLIVFIPKTEDKGWLYPDDFYEFAANCVVTLQNRHPIDLDNPDHMREYYQLLYQDGGKDDPSLLQAVNGLDFVAVDEAYKLIKQTGHNVIVPYDCALFDSIRKEAMKTGLTHALMSRARPITVSSYERDKVQDTCERLAFYQAGRRCEPSDSDWFLLGSAEDYDASMGLQFRAGFDGIV